jgi:asparagine synthase (glutamine-hydrolysing)
MRVFVCLLDPRDRGMPEPIRRRYESLARTRGLTFRWQSFDHVAVLTAWDDPHGDPLLAREGEHVAVGVARLDNRPEVEEWTRAAGTDLTDLHLVLRTIVRLGHACISRFLGDFAFVAWDPTKRMAVAACDALAIRKLYHAERGGLLAFAGRAEALGSGDDYNIQYLSEQVAGAESSPELSVYEDVCAVPAGTLVILGRGRPTSHTYWSPEQVDPEKAPSYSERDAADHLRFLLIEAVRSRLSRDGGTWSQLSGGLDSSSVVSISQWLVETGHRGQGLAGTVTYVDRPATPADEREYSEVIVTRWGLRNDTIVDPPMWYDERYRPPRLDQPRPNFMFYPREARLCEIVAAGGGRVLLTGQGPDEYLRGSMFFFADWLAQGRVREAIREMVRRAAIGRVSFWELAYRNAFVPMIPRGLKRWLGPDITRLPPWVEPGIARRYDLHRRRYELALCEGAIGSKYRHCMVRSMVGVGKTVGHLLLDDSLDVRHPFLDRRLVEFGLGLPSELTTRPYAGKWVLREAMRGIVPEAVRTRIGKGSQNERHAWSLTAQRQLLEPLVREPILGDLGVVDGRKLRTAFDAAPHQGQRRGDPHAALQQVLAVEAWLQIRAGRWPRGVPQ